MTVLLLLIDGELAELDRIEANPRYRGTGGI